MKRYLKLLSLFGLLILSVAPLFNSKEASADANTFCAKSWGQVDSGDFEDNYLDSAKDGGVKFKSLKPKFNTNSEWMQTYSGKINLRERCNGKITKKGESSDSPYRYWFWLKVNKRANGPPTWYTRGYTGTLEPIPGSNYNAYYHSDCAQVSRIYPKAQKGTFFESIGTSGYYRLCLYVVDIKNWYNKLSKKKPYSGFLYLHSLTRIRSICNYDGPPNPANDITKSDLTTLDKWKGAARARGFRESGLKTYWKHYNQRINLNTKTYREFKVHKIATTKEHPILGDYTNELAGTKEWKRATAGSILKFSNIRGYQKDKDSPKYYLKGIVVRGEGTRKKVGTDHGHFYILDNYNDNPICGTTKLTKKYSHQNSKYSGSERDSLSGMKYVYDNVIKISYDDRTFSMSRSDTYNPERVHTNKSGKTGGHSWETLSKHIQDLYVKIPEDKSEIFLIYQKIPQGDVFARKHYRDWSDKDNDYKEVDTTKYKEIDKLPRGKTKCSYSIAKAADKDSKAVSPVSVHPDIPYYARKIKMTYTPAGKTKSKEILIDTNDDLNGSGLDSPFWSGKDSEKEALKAVIEKAMKKVKADDVNPLADVKFDIYYYQPKTPTVGLMYYQYYNDKGQAAYTLVGATEPKCVHPGSTQKSRYGSIKFESSIRVGKVNGKYVRVTDANQALATDVESVDLTSAKAYS